MDGSRLTRPIQGRPRCVAGEPRPYHDSGAGVSPVNPGVSPANPNAGGMPAEAGGTPLPLMGSTVGGPGKMRPGAVAPADFWSCARRSRNDASSGGGEFSSGVSNKPSWRARPPQLLRLLHTLSGIEITIPGNTGT